MKRKFENQLTEDDVSHKKVRFNRVKRFERENNGFIGGSASGDEEEYEEECVKRLKMCNTEFRVYNHIYNFKKIDKNNIPSYIK